MTKKVLLIGFPSPLRRGGSPRLLGLAKYLPLFGWKPTILSGPLDRPPEGKTRICETKMKDNLGILSRLLGSGQPEDLTSEVKRKLAVRTTQSFVDKLLTFGGEISTYPDFYRGWEKFGYQEGTHLLESEEFQAMISCHPKISHIIAKKLRDKYKIPWVADLPDLWSQNYNYRYSQYRRVMDRRLEIKTLSSANVMTTVSEPLAEKLRMLHKNKKIESIPSGYDEELFDSSFVPITGKFSITYTGMIYTGKQDPGKLLRALAELNRDNQIDIKNFDVRFYGEKVGWLEAEIEQFRLADCVKQHGMLLKNEVIRKQRESQVLAFFNWEDPEEPGVYSGKIFEYLGARRPILCTGGDIEDVVPELLRETGAGESAVEISDIKILITKYYHEYKKTGLVTYRGNESAVKKYSQQEMARRFNEILSNLGAC